MTPELRADINSHAGPKMILRAYTAVQPSMRAEATRVIEGFIVSHKQKVGGDSSDVKLPTVAGGGQNGGQTASEGRQLDGEFPNGLELFGKLWFPMMDSNHHKQSQSLLSYH